MRASNLVSNTKRENELLIYCIIAILVFAVNALYSYYHFSNAFNVLSLKQLILSLYSGFFFVLVQLCAAYFIAALLVLVKIFFTHPNDDVKSNLISAFVLLIENALILTACVLLSNFMVKTVIFKGIKDVVFFPHIGVHMMLWYGVTSIIFSFMILQVIQTGFNQSKSQKDIPLI